MRADSSQPYYAPCSVGGLMEPAFLRSARLDADGGPRDAGASTRALWRPLRARLRSALQLAVAAIRLH